MQRAGELWPLFRGWRHCTHGVGPVCRGQVRAGHHHPYSPHVRWTVRRGTLLPSRHVQCHSIPLPGGALRRHHGPGSCHVHCAVQRWPLVRRGLHQRHTERVRRWQVWGHRWPLHGRLQWAVQRWLLRQRHCADCRHVQRPVRVRQVGGRGADRRRLQRHVRSRQVRAGRQHSHRRHVRWLVRRWLLLPPWLLQ